MGGPWKIGFHFRRTKKYDELNHRRGGACGPSSLKDIAPLKHECERRGNGLLILGLKFGGIPVGMMFGSHTAHDKTWNIIECAGDDRKEGTPVSHVENLSGEGLTPSPICFVFRHFFKVTADAEIDGDGDGGIGGGGTHPKSKAPTFLFSVSAPTRLLKPKRLPRHQSAIHTSP